MAAQAKSAVLVAQKALCKGPVRDGIQISKTQQPQPQPPAAVAAAAPTLWRRSSLLRRHGGTAATAMSFNLKLYEGQNYVTLLLAHISRGAFGTRPLTPAAKARLQPAAMLLPGAELHSLSLDCTEALIGKCSDKLKAVDPPQLDRLYAESPLSSRRLER